MSGKLADIVVAVLFLVSASGEQCPDPDLVTPPSGCDPASTAEANLDICLPKKKTLFGVVAIRAAPDVPDWAWTYASNVLARYLDSNQDGHADDSKLIAAMAPTNFRLGFAILKCRGSIGRDRLKDSWLGIARTQGQESLSEDTRFQRQVIEELHHGVFHGLEIAYPTVFRSHNSELSAAIDEAYGNCQKSYVCAMAGDCTHYTCTCTNAPQLCDDAGQYDCSFRAGSCYGVFHYATPSCGGECLVAEGFYHAWTTAYGYKCAGNAVGMASEWEVCTASALACNSQTAKLHALVTGTAASQQTLGYVLPSVLPDGTYSATTVPITTTQTSAGASTGAPGSGGTTTVPPSVSSAPILIMGWASFMMVASGLLF